MAINGCICHFINHCGNSMDLWLDILGVVSGVLLTHVHMYIGMIVFNVICSSNWNYPPMIRTD